MEDINNLILMDQIEVIKPDGFAIGVCEVYEVFLDSKRYFLIKIQDFKQMFEEESKMRDWLHENNLMLGGEDILGETDYAGREAFAISMDSLFKKVDQELKDIKTGVWQKKYLSEKTFSMKEWLDKFNNPKTDFANIEPKADYVITIEDAFELVEPEDDDSDYFDDDCDYEV